MNEVVGKIAKDFRSRQTKFLRRFTRWIDPKLEPYRAKSRPDPKTAPNVPAAVAPERIIVTESPKTRAELFEVIENAPLSIFSRGERELISAIFNLNKILVAELMIPEKSIVYVDADEVLGPLILDRLYKSCLTHFPVLDKKGTVLGSISTSRLNSLEIRKSVPAKDYLDPGVFYVRSNYTLREALDVFLRNDCHICLVVNNYGKLSGMLTFSDLCRVIFGEIEKDNFLRDDDRLAVAKRQFAIDLEVKKGQ